MITRIYDPLGIVSRVAPSRLKVSLSRASRAEASLGRPLRRTLASKCEKCKQALPGHVATRRSLARYQEPIAAVELQSVAKLMIHLTVFGECSSIEIPGKTSPPPSPLHNVDQARNYHSTGKSDQHWLGGRGVIWETVYFLAVVRSSSRRFQKFAVCVMSFATDCTRVWRRKRSVRHNTSLVAAKARAKQDLTIPRIELKAGHMAADLANNTRNALKCFLVSTTVCCPDSSVALHWIPSNGIYRQFVAKCGRSKPGRSPSGDTCQQTRTQQTWQVVAEKSPLTSGGTDRTGYGIVMPGQPIVWPNQVPSPQWKRW